MNRQRFVRNILKMENEWLAADLVQLARKNPVAAEAEITEKNVDAEYLEPLQIINAYTMEIPEAGFHKTEL